MSTTDAGDAITATNDPTHFFYDEKLTTAILTGLQETLYEMCNLACEFENSYMAQNWLPQGYASGSVELTSELQRGLMRVHFSADALQMIKTKLLGHVELTIDETLDCAGALVGIIYGRMKAILNPLGYNFMMAIPQMHYTEQLSPPAGEVNQLIVPFKVSNSACYIQVILIN